MGRPRRLRAFLLRYSGLRIRDVVCLQRDRIKDGKLMLYTQKTRQAVFIPLPQVVVDAVAATGTKQLPFWSGVGNPKTGVADWQRTLRRLLKLAKTENGHAHRSRDTSAVRLLGTRAGSSARRPRGARCRRRSCARAPALSSPSPLERVDGEVNRASTPLAGPVSTMRILTRNASAIYPRAAIDERSRVS